MSLADYPLVSDWLGWEGDAQGGRLILRSGKVDIGQRITTALVQIAHEELTLPHARIAIAPVRTGAAPDEGITSGSNSLEQSGHAIRCACASLRARLCARAAALHGGAPGDWRLEAGALHAPRLNRPLPLGEVIEGLDLAQPVDATLTPRPAMRGAPPPPMRGISGMVRGTYAFVQDLDLKDMLHARVIRPPNARARLDDLAREVTDSLADKGLALVRDGSFLSVAGEDEWAVIKAARRIAAACEWTHAEIEEGDVQERLVRKNARRITVREGQPLPDAPLPKPLEAPDHTARYERPFTMHGALAPSAALAKWRGGMLRITSHSQGIYPLRDSIAESLGLAPETVELTHMPGSGCYGHNGADDAAFEAALIARALPERPVLLKWSREDEHGWEPYGPPMAVELAARLKDGRITAWEAEAIGGTHRGRPRPGANGAGPAKLLANRLRASPIPPQPAPPNLNREGGLQRNLTPGYDFGETRLVKALVDPLPLRTSALRCLGGAANVFATESFLDEVAEAAGEDALNLRRRHLDDTRARAVLDRLEEAVTALPPLTEGQGRGLAYARYKNAMARVGVSVDLTLDDRARITLERAVIVADAGRIVDADGLSAQLEGGFLQAAGWALCEEVTWDRDGVTSRDWDSYPVLRFDALPEIEVILLEPEGAPSTGAGEASPGPTLAAIANALYAASGIRMRRLPFTPEAIMARAAEI